MLETDYTVTGMTRGHCVRSVTEEVTRVPGVAALDVDLPSGRVRVASAEPLDHEAVLAAIEEAGFEVAR